MSNSLHGCTDPRDQIRPTCGSSTSRRSRNCAPNSSCPRSFCRSCCHALRLGANSKPMTDLDRKALASIFALFAAVAALIFISAGAFDYWQAWVFLSVYFSASIAITLYLMRYDRQLLERRMRGGPTAEKEKAQKIIMSFFSIAFVALLVVPALDHRLHWSVVPGAVSLASDVLIGLGYFIIFLVFRENSFSAATVKIHPGQKVISTGPYALVRHPMYAGGLLMLASIPLALGSWWGLLIVLLLIPALLWRMFDEERLLAMNLPGYSAYQSKVRYRLIPLLW
jgi:protein-S-isoprenylcysteine O-methyltransferase Ste14